MNRHITFSNHPFRFLIYLEWILLAITALTSLLPSRHQDESHPELTIFLFIIFAIMGLKLPMANEIQKIFYTAAQIILIIIINYYWVKAFGLFPVIFLILVIRSCLIFELSGRLVVTSLSFGLFIYTLTNRMNNSPARLAPLAPIYREKFRFFGFNIAILFCITLVFILLLMNTVLSERKSKEELAVANKKLREYALKIENQATLEERNRIAREIHDSLGHSLTALNLQLETGLKLWQSNPNKAKEFLTRAKGLGSTALQEVRDSVSAIRSYKDSYGVSHNIQPWQEESFEKAIIALLNDVKHSTDVAPLYTISLEEPLTNDINIPIYRIIQESLTNICKYAKASEIRLELFTSRRKLHLQIQDNGVGFNPGQNTTGFGLQSMCDRAMALGGNLEIETSPGQGCMITVIIPLGKYD
ncbi:sensor histidine kinase [Calothrix sp. PCC 6303]|uniref:sensor histidine kinase n=1 Tax=Calothrix sp. PCC 6303 TaxID=1170562 RepID=UPI0002A05287|nr:sensor histidine kinase [Calothrix sp. PCC 6303]AFY99143.1 integral membrane sensor signal transduction histidine kinase [Calothrix sp. PCC 6303]